MGMDKRSDVEGGQTKIQAQRISIFIYMISQNPANKNNSNNAKHIHK
jgi:hypothetical protein